MTSNPTLKAFLVPPEDIYKYADEMRVSMERALDKRTDWKVDDILTRAADGDILVWAATHDGKLIGHVTARPRGRDLVIITLGGLRARSWIPLIHEQIKWLIDEGYYDNAVAGVRVGLERWLKKIGWKTRRVIMEIK